MTDTETGESEAVPDLRHELCTSAAGDALKLVTDAGLTEAEQLSVFAMVVASYFTQPTPGRFEIDREGLATFNEVILEFADDMVARLNESAVPALSAELEQVAAG